MANILQGFYSMPQLANNTSGVIASFGELSTETRTFTKDEKNFSDANYPNVELITFQTYDSYKVSTTPASTFMRTILALGNWLYNQHVGGNIPTATRKEDFLAALAIEFPAFSSIKIGSILTTDDGSKNFIDWVSFTANDGTNDWTCKIWVRNQSMYEEYEGGQIIVIPPIDPIDGLQNSKSAVANLLLAVSPSAIVEKMNSLQGRYRATSTQTIQLTWHDPADSSAVLTTSWYIIVYGNMINDLDNIKNAIREYLSQYSGYTNWNTVYPELYSSNEFVYMPLYDNVAFPDTSISQGGYLSIARTGNLGTIAQNHMPTGYAQMSNIATFIADNMMIMAHTYRTELMLVLANPANANSIYQLTELYPDYRALPTTETDFDRMATNTKEFIVQLQYALNIAYTFKETDVAPDGYYKVKRGVRTYLGFIIHGYLHLVLIKDNY